MKQLNDQNLIFGIEEFGCQSECSLNCGKAPCKPKKIFNKVNNEPQEDDYTCDCSAIYAVQNLNDNQLCAIENSTNPKVNYSKNSILSEILLTSPVHTIITVAESLRLTENEGNNNQIISDYLIHKVLNKMWFLLRFPTLNEELHTLFELGP